MSPSSTLQLLVSLEGDWWPDAQSQFYSENPVCSETSKGKTCTSIEIEVLGMVRQSDFETETWFCD